MEIYDIIIGHEDIASNNKANYWYEENSSLNKLGLKRNWKRNLLSIKWFSS